MTAGLAFESRAVGWSHADRWRRIGGWGFVSSSALAALAFAFATATNAGLAVGLVCLGSMAFAAVSGAVAGIATWIGPTHRRGAVRIADGAILVRAGDEEQRIDRADVQDGWVEDPSGVRLRLRSGAVLSVEAPDADTAEAMLRAAGVSVSQRVVGVQLSSAASRVPFGVGLAVTGTALLSLLTVFFCGVLAFGMVDIVKNPNAPGALGGMALLLVMAVVLGSVLLGTIGTLLRRRATIGVDGVSIQGLVGRQFVPYADVTDVVLDVQGVRLRTRRGDVALPTWSRGEPPLSVDGAPPAAASGDGARRQHVIVQRIRRALALRQPGGPELAMLDRAGRSVEAWRDDVRALARRPGDYRHVHLAAQDLEEIVTDATAPAERRIAAVMALSDERNAGAKERVRIAIDTCADEELKAALEQAAIDELDEEALRKAVRGS